MLGIKALLDATAQRGQRCWLRLEDGNAAAQPGAGPDERRVTACRFGGAAHDFQAALRRGFRHGAPEETARPVEDNSRVEGPRDGGRDGGTALRRDRKAPDHPLLLRGQRFDIRKRAPWCDRALIDKHLRRTEVTKLLP